MQRVGVAGCLFVVEGGARAGTGCVLADVAQPCVRRVGSACCLCIHVVGQARRAVSQRSPLACLEVGDCFGLRRCTSVIEVAVWVPVCGARCWLLECVAFGSGTD